MKTKGWTLLIFIIYLGSILSGCAGMKPIPTKIEPILVSVESIERLNAIAPKPPYQRWDSLVFKIDFKLTNPNHALAKVDDFYFEMKVDDGTPEKTIILASSMPSVVIPGRGEFTWSFAGPYIYGAVFGSYALRGVGGSEGLAGVAKKLDELWEDLGADKRKFFIEGHITTSLPDFPGLGITRQQFRTEFTIPKL